MEYAHRPVASLSGGELQRVFIARALAQETPVLILDEPTAHLDISYQTGVFDTIERIRRTTGVTVLVAMHDLTLAAQYCAKIAALHEGSVFAFGEPSQVLTTEGGVRSVRRFRVDHRAPGPRNASGPAGWAGHQGEEGREAVRLPVAGALRGR